MIKYRVESLIGGEWGTTIYNKQHDGTCYDAARDVAIDAHKRTGWQYRVIVVTENVAFVATSQDKTIVAMRSSMGHILPVDGYTAEVIEDEGLDPTDSGSWDTLLPGGAPHTPVYGEGS